MNKEAITILKREFSEYKDTISVYARKRKKAFDMAIQALEQQPSEDCISRQAVIRLVEQYPNIIGNRCSGLIADIKHLPSVTPKSEDNQNEIGMKSEWDDCISRQAVKSQMLKYGFKAPDMTVTEFVEDCLPSVIPQQKWIPVSERLPEHFESVLAYDGEDMFVAWYDITKSEWHSVDDYFDTDYPIVAWMPLPQPYKEDKG